jgi:hypothetical protein
MGERDVEPDAVAVAREGSASVHIVKCSLVNSRHVGPPSPGAGATLGRS